MITYFEIIEKENIQDLKFPSSDVLKSKDAINHRDNELRRALSLGNLEHSKTKIFFEDNKSKRVVETTVWAVTENRVVLKQGVVIPINRIFRSL